jgi:hypothetical protein
MQVNDKVIEHARQYNFLTANFGSSSTIKVSFPFETKFLGV